MYSPSNTARVERICIAIGIALVVILGSAGAFLMGGRGAT
jgi:hypothetical protein